jgi:hypothetical protein
MLRLRHYVSGRAKRNDEAKRDEGRKLLAPLTDAVKKMRAAAAARATIRAKKAGEEGGPEGQDGEPGGDATNEPPAQGGAGPT